MQDILPISIRNFYLMVNVRKIWYWPYLYDCNYKVYVLTIICYNLRKLSLQPPDMALKRCVPQKGFGSAVCAQRDR